MYCQRSLAAKTRVSLVFSQPEIAPDAGNGFALVLLQPYLPTTATIATAMNANSHFLERIITE
jgi:hypothetical protein